MSPVATNALPAELGPSRIEDIVVTERGRERLLALNALFDSVPDVPPRRSSGELHAACRDS